MTKNYNETLTIFMAVLILSLTVALSNASADMHEGSKGMDTMTNHAEMLHDHGDKAVDAEDDKAEMEKSADVEVTVDGLVCDFCAQALNKVFKKQEEVASIDVSLTDKLVSVYFNEGQSLDSETITTLITDSGYNVREIKRDGTVEAVKK